MKIDPNEPRERIFSTLLDTNLEGIAGGQGRTPWTCGQHWSPHLVALWGRCGSTNTSVKTGGVPEL